MGRKYILLISDKTESICYKGEGTVGQIKNDIEDLVNNRIEPESLEVIPVVGARIQKDSLTLGIIFGTIVTGLGYLSWKYYEGLHKRARKRRGESASS